MASEIMYGLTEDQHALMALLVLDLGYRAEPQYGRVPMRHYFAWKKAVAGLSAELLAAVIQNYEKQIAQDEARGLSINGKVDMVYATYTNLANVRPTPA